MRSAQLLLSSMSSHPDQSTGARRHELGTIQLDAFLRPRRSYLSRLI